MARLFRAVEWMREVRARIDTEDAGLNWEERRRKTLKILEQDALWVKLRSRVMETPAGPRGKK